MTGLTSVRGVTRADDLSLPWHRSLLHGRRCRARLSRGESHGYHGRCDLRRGHAGAHVLERGLEIVRFRQP